MMRDRRFRSALFATLVVAVATIGLAAPASAQAVGDDAAMTIIVSHEGGAERLARDTLGSLTVLVGGVECETLTLSDSETPPEPVETQIGTESQPAACGVVGATVTFERGDGLPLLVETLFEPGGTFELTNFAPAPPSTGGEPPTNTGPALVARSDGSCTDVTIEATGLEAGTVVHVLLQEVGQQTAGEIPGSPITTDAAGSFVVTIPEEELPYPGICNFKHDGFAVTVLGDEAGKPGEKLAGPVYTQSSVVGPVPEQGGVALVQWTGGTVDALEEAASLDGCDLASAWVTVLGQFVGYIAGAPPFVNAAWVGEVGEQIVAQPLLVTCASPKLAGIESCEPLVEFRGDVHAFGFETPEGAIGDFVDDLDRPSRRLIEETVSDSRVTWQYATDDNIVVGSWVTERYSFGWVVSNGAYCA